MNRGDIISLGNHRLMCGDSTNSDDVARLMGTDHAKILFTSPPYSDIRAYNLSRENGYEISKIHDERFGSVNVYHVDILKEVFR